MSVVSKLSEKLLKQPFEEFQDEAVVLKKYQQYARGYSEIENSIAVLSDLKSNKSYIFNGGIAERLGIAQRNNTQKINSIWEEDIFTRIHSDDLLQKHILELQFFHLLKNLPSQQRPDYHIVSKMRMCDKSGKFVTIQHRMFYVCDYPSGTLWLSLCLYNYSYEHFKAGTGNGIIVNSTSGEVIIPEAERCNTILSRREKEILQLIEQGKMSKEIADFLSISINTVNRHRQNILEKLRVKNSLEACRIAKLMKLF